jgi:4-hydroxy-2-oxoheptanedioate aldolase
MASLIEKFSAGQKAFASWVALGNTYSAELLSTAGYDCLVLDTQHGAISWEQLGGLIQAIDIHNTPSLVRIGGVDQTQAMRALDLGAAGVIVPMVSTPEEARRAASAMRYPPEGIRSFGPVRNYYSASASQQAALCFAMIETAEGMANLDEIAAVDGIDGLFVGPVDLALALGLGPVLDLNDQVFAAISTIADACARHNKLCASASLSPAYSRKLIDIGVQLIVQGSDLGMIRRGMQEDIKGFHQMCSQSSEK